MKEVLTRWYQRYLSEEEAVILLVMLTMAFAVMLFFGDILAPVLVAIVLAYLMQGVAGMEGYEVDAFTMADHQRYFFFQTMSTVGALVLLVVHGPGNFSMDEQQGTTETLLTSIASNND